MSRIFSRITSAVCDENGQMSIFIALIFQVLFVLFAMIINIGLLVHDKINLQNAVDLGAYYGAQRQAEILNEIAHINYQIRQDYKLLVWRYRVLGTLGRQGGPNPLSIGDGRTGFPPARKPPGVPLNDVEWVNTAYGTQPELPFVCIAHDLWSDFTSTSSQLENHCFNALGSSIPDIPRVSVIAPWVPLVGAAAGFSQQARLNARYSRNESSVLNWAFTMQMIHAYKLSIATRKSVIFDLRKRLVDLGSQMRDLRMESVREGVQRTILKNLTSSNQESFDSDYFAFQNGLSDPACAGPDQDGAPTLPEVQIAPLLLYLVWNGLSPEVRFQNNFGAPLNPSMVQTLDPSGLMRMMAQGEPAPDNLMHSSLGFEKNPWCMAYVAVRARAQPRKPFAPFGQAVTLEARAFAQPFGGRIGPWYRTGWSPSSMRSDVGEPVDPLAGPRLVAGGGFDANDVSGRIPNYSRYPGDSLGLRSELAMGAQRALIGSYGAPTPKDQRLKLLYYAGFDDIPQHGDPLAWDVQGPQDQVTPGVDRIRRAELAAVAPDLFDVTYYSIDPDYFSNYLRLNNEVNRFPNMRPIETIGKMPRPAPDLGGRNGVPGLAQQNVSAQIRNATGSTPALDSELLASGKLYWMIRSWHHLLTSWAPTRAVDFSFPRERFGKCDRAAPIEDMIPGRCVAGGRVGYSVRIVSKSHLLGAWPVGGSESSQAPIRNRKVVSEF
jgi:hypothetical protein